jgi:glutaminase
VDRYLHACSVGVNTEDLAIMGATLANGGVNPKTNRRVVSAETARGQLSAMATAGMYDDSGPWFFRVGIPAKSGVSGGVVAVVPNRFAIAVYSPPLDPYGNSVRASKVIKALSDLWKLHMLHATAHQ